MTDLMSREEREGCEVFEQKMFSARMQFVTVSEIAARVQIVNDVKEKK